MSAVDNSGYYHRFPARPDDETYGGHLEDFTIFFWIGGPPHQVTVTVLDNLTRPLEGSQVMIANRLDISDASGIATLWVSNSTYNLSVYWQDVLVHKGSIAVRGDTLVTVTVAVFDPVFKVVDDQGDPVEGAVAIVEHPNGTVLSVFGRSDPTGTFTLHRMPVGEYQISLLWLGVVVYDEDLTIESNGPFTLASYVYTLGIRVEDDLGVGLHLAQVIVTNASTHSVFDSKMTDMDGNLSSRLSLGSYDFAVYWRNSLVHDGTRDYFLNASASIVLRANIFTLSITVVIVLVRVGYCRTVIQAVFYAVTILVRKI